MRYILVLVLLLSMPLSAHQLTLEECEEGAEFIGNAAVLRDSGYPEGYEEAFVSRAIEDIEAIKQFPPEFRWFVQDDEDADYLLSEILRVFREPQAPTRHYQDFFNRCIQR